MELEQFWRSLDLVCEEEASSEDKDDFDNTSTSSISQATMSSETAKDQEMMEA